jgi:TolB-like protein
MLRPILLALLLIIFPATVRAVDPPTTAPSQPHTIEAPPQMMVYPFSSIGDAGSQQWIGQAIQQSLLVQVSQPRALAWTIPATQPASATNDPATAAAKAGAGLAVFGSFQISGENVRITGQVVHVASGQVIGALSATGAVRDLFKLEDTLGTQLRDVLLPLQNDVADAGPQQVPSYQSPDDTIRYPSSDEDYSMPDNYPSYGGYPGYYTAPYWGVPFDSFFFFNVRHFHDHDRDHRHDGHMNFQGNGFSHGSMPGNGFTRGSPGTRMPPQRFNGPVGSHPMGPTNPGNVGGGMHGGEHR